MPECLLSVPSVPVSPSRGAETLFQMFGHMFRCLVTSNQPSVCTCVLLLVSCREVETLFHEFGHALQHMMTTVDEGLVAGIRGVDWDAVELPSQFMENWCYDKPTLYSFAKHYQTGEPLPTDMFERLKAAKTFRSATQMLRQVSGPDRGGGE